MNYSPEQTEHIKNEYNAEPTRDTVDRLAAELKKSPKSIIGKLSREGVYRREMYTSKTGETPVTKLELVSDIANELETEADNLQGLDKTPKQTLKNLLELIRAFNE